MEHGSSRRVRGANHRLASVVNQPIGLARRTWAKRSRGPNSPLHGSSSATAGAPLASVNVQFLYPTRPVTNRVLGGFGSTLGCIIIIIITN